VNIDATANGCSADVSLHRRVYLRLIPLTANYDIGTEINFTFCSALVSVGITCSAPKL
jgi:hypothetical protein